MSSFQNDDFFNGPIENISKRAAEHKKFCEEQYKLIPPISTSYRFFEGIPYGLRQDIDMFTDAMKMSDAEFDGKYTGIFFHIPKDRRLKRIGKDGLEILPEPVRHVPRQIVLTQEQLNKLQFSKKPK